MGPVEAVQTCLRKYVSFTGRASRPELWWFFLFVIVAYLIAYAIDSAMRLQLLSAIVGLGLFLPQLAVQIRRLHDTNRSGWWILIALIPLIGTIWLIVLYASRGTEGDNRYGPPPGAMPAAPATA